MIWEDSSLTTTDAFEWCRVRSCRKSRVRKFTWFCCNPVPVWTAGWPGMREAWRLLAVMVVAWAGGRRRARILGDRPRTWRWSACRPVRYTNILLPRSAPTGWGPGPVARNHSPAPGYHCRFRICRPVRIFLFVSRIIIIILIYINNCALLFNIIIIQLVMCNQKYSPRTLPGTGIFPNLSGSFFKKN